MTFSHHALIATLPTVQQATLLLEAYDKGWTRDEFRDYLVEMGVLRGESSPREDWRKEAAAMLDKLMADLLVLAEKIRR